MSNPSDLELIQTTLDELRPMILGHGGDIEIVSYQDFVLSVRLHGACTNCPISFYTLKLGIEESLRQKLPNLKEVIAVEE